MATNEQYFEAALEGDPKDTYGYERTLDQVFIRFAARGETVKFGFETWRGGKVLIASTSMGNYWFIFDQNDNLVLEQVL